MAEEDLPTITESEYAALTAGSGGQSSALEEDIPTITESEYETIKNPLSLGAAWQYAKETPGALWGAAKSIPAGLSNLAHAPLDVLNVGADVTSRVINDIFGTNIPAYEANYDRLERTGRGVGTLASGLAGGAVGTMTGGPLGGIIGGSAGVQGFNEALKFFGVDPESDPEQDAANLLRNTVQGGVTLGAAKGTSATLSPLAGTARIIKEGVQKNLVGYDPTKGKIAVGGLLDDSGNVVKKASEAVKQVTRDELQLKALDESGFFKEVSPLSSPAKASLKLQQFKESKGSDIGSIVDDASSLEKNILSSSEAAPWQKAAYLDETAPKFEAAQDFINSLKRTDEAQFQRLNKKFETVKKSWEESDKTLKDLKQIQEEYGQLNQRAFDPKAAISDQLEGQLSNALYGDLAGALQKRISGLNPELGTKFTKANKAYSAASNFEDSAFSAARKKPVGKVIKDLFNPLSATGGAMTLGAAAGAGFLGAPALVPLIIAGRGAMLLKDLFPAATMKGAAGVESALRGTKSAIGGSALPASIGLSANSALPQEALANNPNLITELFGAATADAAEMPRAARLAEEATRLTEESPMPTESPKPRDSLYKAVIAQESGGKADAVSDVGALGLMQVMPATARDIAKELGVKEYNLKDPETNKRFGQYYLDKLLNMFDGDEGLALTAYHSGYGKVKKLLKKSGGSSLDDILSVPFKDGGLGPVGRKYAKQVLARKDKITALA